MSFPVFRTFLSMNSAISLNSVTTYQATLSCYAKLSTSFGFYWSRLASSLRLLRLQSQTIDPSITLLFSYFNSHFHWIWKNFIRLHGPLVVISSITWTVEPSFGPIASKCAPIESGKRSGSFCTKIIFKVEKHLLCHVCPLVGKFGLNE